MRLWVIPLLLTAAMAPLATAGGTVGCEVVPFHVNALVAIDDCSVALTSGPGTIVIQVSAILGTTGPVVIEGNGPGNSAIVAECTLLATTASCIAPIRIQPAAGDWIFTGRAQVVNAVNFQPGVRMDITYP